MTKLSICEIIVLHCCKVKCGPTLRGGYRKGRQHPSSYSLKRICVFVTIFFRPSFIFGIMFCTTAPRSTKMDSLEAEADFEFTSRKLYEEPVLNLEKLGGQWFGISAHITSSRL